jgi:site-specific DNA-methyltransferase (adenine-specific)
MLNREGHKITWLGIELEKQWCEVAESRLKKLNVKTEEKE